MLNSLTLQQSRCFVQYKVYFILIKLITDQQLCSQIQMGTHQSGIQTKTLEKIQHPHLGTVVVSDFITQVRTYGDPVSFQDAHCRFQNRIKRINTHPYLIKIINLKKQRSQQLCSYGGKITLQLQKYQFDINTLFEKRKLERQHFQEKDLLTFLLKVTQAIISIYDSGYRTVHIDGKSILISHLQGSNLKDIQWQKVQVKILDSMLSSGNIYYKVLTNLQQGQKNDSKKNKQEMSKQQKLLERLYLSPQLVQQLKIGNPDPLFTPKCDVFSLGVLALSMCCLQQLDPYYDYFQCTIDYQNLIYRLSRIVYSDTLKKLLAQMLQFDSQERIGLVSLQERLKKSTQNLQNSQLQRKRSSSSKMLSQMLTVSSSKLFSRQKSIDSPGGSTYRKSEMSIDKKMVRKPSINSVHEQNILLNSSRKIMIKRSDSKQSINEKTIKPRQQTKISEIVNDQTSYLKQIIKNKASMNSSKTVQSSTSATRQFFQNIAKNTYPQIGENFKEQSKLLGTRNSQLELLYNSQREQQKQIKSTTNSICTQQYKTKEVIKTIETIKATFQNKNSKILENKQNLIRKQHPIQQIQSCMHLCQKNQNKPFQQALKENNKNRQSFAKKRPTLNIQSLDFVSPIPSIYPQTNPISQPSEFSCKQGLSYADLGLSPESRIEKVEDFQMKKSKKIAMKPFQFMEKDKQENQYCQSYNHFNKALMPDYKQSLSIQKSQQSYGVNEYQSMNMQDYEKQSQFNKNFSKFKQKPVLPLQFCQNNGFANMFKTAQSVQNSTDKKPDNSESYLYSHEKNSNDIDRKLQYEIQDNSQSKYSKDQPSYSRINLSNGKYFEGILSQNGPLNGNGILYDQYDKIIYSGSWKNAQFDGFGTFYPTASQKMNIKPNYKQLSSCLYEKYEGQFVSNYPNGFGTFFYKNGDKFSGCIQNGIASGYGCYYFNNGQIISGMWRNNQYVEIEQ